jgi:hypothetical protein
MTPNNTVPLQVIANLVEVHAPSIGTGLAELYALDAVREFCRRAQVVHRDLPIYGSSGAEDFEVPVPDGLEIVRIQSIHKATQCGEMVEVTDRYGFRAPAHLYQIHQSCMDTREDTTLMLVVSVSPTSGATEIPAELVDYALAAMKPTEIKATASSAALMSAHHSKIFETAIRNAGHTRVWGQTRQKPSLRGKGFV